MWPSTNIITLLSSHLHPTHNMTNVGHVVCGQKFKFVIIAYEIYNIQSICNYIGLFNDIWIILIYYIHIN